MASLSSRSDAPASECPSLPLRGTRIRQLDTLARLPPPLVPTLPRRNALPAAPRHAQYLLHAPPRSCFVYSPLLLCLQALPERLQSPERFAPRSRYPAPPPCLASAPRRPTERSPATGERPHRQPDVAHAAPRTRARPHNGAARLRHTLPHSEPSLVRLRPIGHRTACRLASPIFSVRAPVSFSPTPASSRRNLSTASMFRSISRLQLTRCRRTCSPVLLSSKLRILGQ